MASMTTDWAMPKRRWSFSRFTAALKASKQRRRANRQPYLIAERELRMNDHMLRDIGLTTDEVKHLLSEPRQWL